MTAVQQLRETLERELTNASTRRQERLIGQALVELSEGDEFREYVQLHPAPARAVGSVRVPPDFTLASRLQPARPSHPMHPLPKEVTPMHASQRTDDSSITLQPNGPNGLRILVTGPITNLNRDKLKDIALAAITARGPSELGPRRLELDLSDTGYVDTLAISVLLSVRRHAEAHEVPLVLVGLSQEQREVFAACNLAPLFTFEDAQPSLPELRQPEVA